MKIILQNVPAFNIRWQEYCDYWGDEKAGICNDIAEFSRYVKDIIIENQVENLPMIFNLMEHLLRSGDDEIKNAIATCFLENLSNVASTGKIDSKEFIHLLGPESLTYLRAWDEFTGVNTEGL